MSDRSLASKVRPGRRFPHRGVAWVAIAASAIALNVQAAPTPPRLSGESTDVLAIEIPVQVVRNGQPVRGLTAADFTVSDGKTKQEITGFEVIDLGAAPGSPGAPPPVLSGPSRRHFLMLFDLANSEPEAIVKARGAARQVMDRMHPSDLVAVALYSDAQGAQLVLGFTSDRRQAAVAIDTLGLPDLFDRTGDPLDLVIDSNSSGAGNVTTPGSAGGAALLADLIDLRDRNRAADRRYQAVKLADFTGAFAELAQLMASVSGRKYVVLLSEGFDSSLLVGTDDYEAEEGTKVEKGSFWKVDNDARFGNTRSGNRLERMAEQFRRSDCVIQAVDIGGLREDGARRNKGQEGLFAMADPTGGELFTNWNDLSAALGKMLDRTQLTYLITVQPQVERDGAYHPLKVELKHPAGARVSHRSGYYAPRPFAERDPLARRLDTADAIMSGTEGGELSAQALAVALRGTAEKAYVPVVVAIDGASLLRDVTREAAPEAPAAASPTPAAADPNHLPVEVYAYALGPDGSIGDFFGQTLGLDLATVGDKLQAGGIDYVGHLELSPGDWSLRVMVRNGRTGASRLRVIPIRVPSFEEGRTVLPAPLFLRSPEQEAGLLRLREVPRGELSEAPFPFQSEGKPYLPASAPSLATGQTVRVAQFAWNLPSAEVRARAQVLTPEGNEIPGGTLRLVASESAAGGGDLLLATFEPTGLAPGRYRLRIRLALGEGVEPVLSDAAPFEVR